MGQMGICRRGGRTPLFFFIFALLIYKTQVMKKEDVSVAIHLILMFTGILLWTVTIKYGISIIYPIGINMLQVVFIFYQIFKTL